MLFIYYLAATATVQVVIHDDYPSSAPVMIICLKWNKDRTALNDQGIKVNQKYNKWIWSLT